ncbi:hypothetical protein E6O75_ATG03941 [Venturia nashicola]|uniref:Uncharacterized protein n=1 Tax=Venturia nashicola TaxID=86259 RepID=A0A4Z1PCF9_9PEZI|nr:hypothetical protein E6O75_ATG03941 [Venturia nashicola]
MIAWNDEGGCSATHLGSEPQERDGASSNPGRRFGHTELSPINVPPRAELHHHFYNNNNPPTAIDIFIERLEAQPSYAAGSSHAVYRDRLLQQSSAVLQQPRTARNLYAVLTVITDAASIAAQQRLEPSRDSPILIEIPRPNKLQSLM